MSLFLLNNMFVEIIMIRVDPNFAEQVNWFESSLPPNWGYSNSLQNARDFPTIQQNGGNDVRASKPDQLL
jgi:hypothetical protein